MTESPATPTYSFLLICQTYFPVLGGSEIEAQRICSALVRHGHRVTVVCAGGEPMPPVQDWIDPQGVPVRIYARRPDGTLKNVIYALRVAGMLVRERENYQFVYFLMQGLHLAVGLPVARLLKKPILMKIAGSGEVPRMSKSRIGRQELAWLKRWAKKILILNEGMRQEAIDYGVSPEQLLLMPNPVDTNEFSPASREEEQQLRDRFEIPQTAPVVMYSGRLAPEKGLPTLLDAFAQVRRTVPDAILVLVGDGSARPALAEQAKQLGLSERNVRFTGRVNPQDVSQWLKIATLFTLVSPSEGFPCALEEAMSTGLASVATDIPGNRQLVTNGVHSILTAVGDTRKIADSIVLLLHDPVLRRHLSQAAREHILEHYSTERVVNLYEDVFKAIMLS
ncbi:MAG: glycosyltransferase family 4 protein [Candidatus Acidiferrum sp.]